MKLSDIKIIFFSTKYYDAYDFDWILRLDDLEIILIKIVIFFRDKAIKLSLAYQNYQKILLNIKMNFS